MAEIAVDHAKKSKTGDFAIDHGKMDDWGRADLPAPPPFVRRNIMAIIGPGTIALSMSIGSGEWLMGPAVASQYGRGPSVDYHGCRPFPGHLQPGVRPLRDVHRGDRLRGVHEMQPGADLLGNGLHSHRVLRVGLAGMGGRFGIGPLCRHFRPYPWTRR